MSGKDYPVSFPIRQQLPFILKLVEGWETRQTERNRVKAGFDRRSFPYRESKTSLATRTALAAVGQPA